MVRTSALPLLAALFLLVASCGSEDPGGACEEGRSLPCACANGESGAQVCANGAFGECVCESSAPDTWESETTNPDTYLPPPDECRGGESLSCTCANGNRGSRACTPDNTWGACMCDDRDAISPPDSVMPDTEPPLPAYRFVRVDDLSETSPTDDGGADIDAFILEKADGSVFYALNVEAYTHGGGDGFMVDPMSALGTPDAFYEYPDVTNCDVTDNFVSLGGMGGFLIVRLNAPLEAGDMLTVLEVGDCDWGGGIAYAEDVEVSISVSSDPTGTWVNLGQGMGPEIMFTIPYL